MHRGVEELVEIKLRDLFSGKAEKVSAELEHAEQVMLEHEKQHFSEKNTKHHKDKHAADKDKEEKYSSLYTSFDVLKTHEDWPPGFHKVFPVDNTSLLSNNVECV